MVLFQWYRPVILTVDHQTERGSKSEQKHIQVGHAFLVGPCTNSHHPINDNR